MLEITRNYLKYRDHLAPIPIPLPRYILTYVYLYNLLVVYFLSAALQGCLIFLDTKNKMGKYHK
jgi:hypothetical protein